jgi:predicted RNA binding protein YcfA (HicA-like mRNA interferase family)
MPKLLGLGQKDAVRGLEKAGFVVIRQGKHIIMSNGARTVTVPRHNVITAYTMEQIASEASCTPKEFRRLL